MKGLTAVSRVPFLSGKEGEMSDRQEKVEHAAPALLLVLAVAMIVLCIAGIATNPMPIGIRWLLPMLAGAFVLVWELRKSGK